MHRQREKEEACEAARRRTRESQHKDLGDQIVERLFNSLSHQNLAHKLILVLQPMKILDAKINNLHAWQETKVKSKRRGHRAVAKREQHSSFCDAQRLVPLEELATGTDVPKMQRPCRRTRRRCGG